MPNSKEATALTQAGLNLIQQALSIYDRELRLVIGNRQFQDMFDLPDRLVRAGAEFGETIRHLAERGDYGAVGNIDAFVLARVEQAKAFVPHYIERTRANGSVISVEGNPLPQGGWVTVYTDITHIKRQERLLRARSEELSDQVLSHTEELAQTNRALASTNKALEETKRELLEMESRTRLTAEMMPAHIARIDLDQTYTFSNRRLGRVIPGRPTDLFGLHASEALGSEAYARISPYFQKAFKGEANVFEFSHEGSGRRIRVALTPDRDEESELITGIYILSMDITEEAQARAALAQTHKRELAAQLTSGVAHDFSNLLTIILGLQSRLGQMDIGDGAKELVQATTAAVRRGGTLLERIASISGKREIHFEPTDIPELLKGLETLAKPTLPDGVELVITQENLADPVVLDAGAVQDGLLNLIINATHAIGSGPGRITLSARPIRETWVEFQVRDTGTGFSDEALERAMDPFFTTKGGDGSGLGLSMVYDQTTVAGGQLKIANAPDGGAVISIRLPLRKPARPIAPRLVLLIEDNADIRASVRTMLTEMGHQVIEAVSAEEALGLMTLEGIGLILSDVILEGVQTGPEFLRGLDAAGVDIPKLLMTSLPSEDPRRAKAGFPVLHKPFTKRELATFLSQEVRT
ncbi:Sensor kinase CckA [Aliiroseovarius sp. xm-v-225]|uniref:hybrid sensor histidine kinase/response regulator n=1 Tax=unclassified Aliiroseovarius TaxID=2623558 RepID=UPI0015681F00|nr:MULTISPECIES: PAS-domain containing protein [unclassified Aliiroseovarius]NRP45220.1 Sensor kinase CckA [Aliiroseovarius sp. xm-m-378]NRP66090.1 Sensor kinase CckA [Aliiroseovarius sp. xm-v-225]NRP93114.1 Sensor kinase CckA [Aliiroseovarius sp. xm-a-134]